LPASDHGLRRVSVHAGTAVVDLALHAGIPVATLIPSIVDIIADGNSSPLEATRYQLSRPGASALDASTTLAQNDIRDGAVLVLTQDAPSLPAPRYDDVAEAVSATLGAAARPWDFQHRRVTRLVGAVAAGCLTAVGGLTLIRNALATNAIRDFRAAAWLAALAGGAALLLAVVARRAYRDAIAGLALSLIATTFGAIAGFLAVPDTAGSPHVLLAATTAAVTSVLAMRLSGCGAVTLTAISCVATVIAIAALVGMITAAPSYAIGSVAALTSLGLLGFAARLSMVLAGLSPRLASSAAPDAPERLADNVIRADRWLARLLAAFSSSAAVGAIVTVLAGAPRLSCIAFGTVTGALLLLRARSDDARRKLAFVVGGMAITATTFGVVARSLPENGAWVVAATAMLGAAAMYLGFVAPAISLSPVVHRGAEVLEFLALVATAPLTCWICGVYVAVRGLNLA
jgi:ESX secretion system protein EccD